MSAQGTLRRILANASWLVSEKILTMGANLLVSIALARGLGPEQFGSLNYALAITTLISPLAALGLNAIVTRELVNHPESEERVMATSLVLRLLGALLGTVICLWMLANHWLGNSAADSIAITALALGSVFSAFQGIDFWFQARTASPPVARMRLSVVLLSASAKVAAVLLKADFTVVAGIFAAELVAQGVGFIGLYIRHGGRIRWQAFDWSTGKAMLQQSFWLILSGLASVIYLKIDQVMLAQMISRESVGTYAVASRLSEVWYFFPNALMISFFPKLLAMKKENTAAYAIHLQKLCDVLLLGALCLAIVVMLVAKPMVLILFGEKYSASAAVLTIHIWASIFVFMRALASKWLLAENLLAYSLVTHGLGALVNVFFNWLFIPHWHEIGAAWATLISYAVASYAAMLVSAKTRVIGKVMTYSLLLPLTGGARYWPVFRSGKKEQV